MLSLLLRETVMMLRSMDVIPQRTSFILMYDICSCDSNNSFIKENGITFSLALVFDSDNHLFSSTDKVSSIPMENKSFVKCHIQDTLFQWGGS